MPEVADTGSHPQITLVDTSQTLERLLPYGVRARSVGDVRDESMVALVDGLHAEFVAFRVPPYGNRYGKTVDVPTFSSTMQRKAYMPVTVAQELVVKVPAFATGTFLYEDEGIPHPDPITQWVRSPLQTVINQDQLDRGVVLLTNELMLAALRELYAIPSD